MNREQEDDIKNLGVVNLNGHCLPFPEITFKVKRDLLDLLKYKQSLSILRLWGGKVLFLDSPNLGGHGWAHRVVVLSASSPLCIPQHL